MEDQIEAHNIYSSDECESSISSNDSSIKEERITGIMGFEDDDDLIRLNEDQPVFRFIEGRFVSKLGDLGGDNNSVRVVGIHRKNWSGFRAGQARLRCFQVCAESDGNKGVRFAWYGGSKDEILRILSHGFGHHEVVHNGIRLSSANYPILSLKNCVVDDEGLMHVLLCRVLLGNTEIVEYGSTQYHPTTKNYDSGVDNAISPTNYIIWSTKMNTHILPEYVISFRASPSLMRSSSMAEILFKKKPTSPWMPIPALISMLSQFVNPSSLNLIKRRHRDLKNRKISRREFVGGVRELVGDELLVAIIKSFQTN